MRLVLLLVSATALAKPSDDASEAARAIGAEMLAAAGGEVAALPAARLKTAKVTAPLGKSPSLVAAMVVYEAVGRDGRTVQATALVLPDGSFGWLSISGGGPHQPFPEADRLSGAAPKLAGAFAELVKTAGEHCTWLPLHDYDDITNLWLPEQWRASLLADDGLVVRGGTDRADVKRACPGLTGTELRLTNLEVNIAARGPLGWALLTRETQPGVDKLTFGPLEIARFEAGGSMELTASPADEWSSVEEFCTKQIAEGDPSDPRRCDVAKLSGGKAPWDELITIRVEDSSMGAAYLAARIDERWWLTLLGNWSTHGANHGSAKVRSLSVKDVIPGGSAELLVRVDRSEKGFTHSYVEFGNDTELLLVCSLGKGRAMSCAELVVGARYTPNPALDGKSYRFSVDTSFDKRGRVIMKPRGKWPAQVDRVRYETTRVLIFN